VSADEVAAIVGGRVLSTRAQPARAEERPIGLCVHNTTSRFGAVFIGDIPTGGRDTFRRAQQPTIGNPPPESFTIAGRSALRLNGSAMVLVGDRVILVGAQSPLGFDDTAARILTAVVTRGCPTPAIGITLGHQFPGTPMPPC
jgi:hypothetical protein